MKKIYYVVIVLAIFFIALFGFIVPQQGGNISSTELYADQLAAADYNETLPIQTVDLSASGRSIFIAFVMLSHVVFANLHLGGAWVAAGTESIYLRTKKERFNRLARSITLFNVILFSAGATFAVAGVLFFISLFPVFAFEAFHIYWWPLLAEAITFGFEIFFLYTYWFSWGKISNGWHQFLGYAFAIDVFFQTLFINTLASGMLTPGASSIGWGEAGLLTMSLQSLMSWWINATTWILQFHRLAAAVSFFGFLVAMLAMFHYLDRGDPASKTYWDLVGSLGLSWGLLGLIFQPVLGLIFMFTIFKNNVQAFRMIMLGNRAWEMVLMVGLLSALFISVLVYYVDRKERIFSMPENMRLQRLFRTFIVVAVISAFILVQPATTSFGVNPLGFMSFKLIALFILTAIGAVSLGVDLVVLRARPEVETTLTQPSGSILSPSGLQQPQVEWGNLSETSRSFLWLSGLLGTAIVIVMGFVRESGRSPFVISQIIPVPGGQAYPTPIPVAQIVIVWILVLVMVVSIFWFTSRVTAEHPEEAEEI
ncbi:MAG: cytochrome ubiquinol oxidase subunit I [Methanomicrobiales archaeon]|nr:cytochrome ubiquinol oxidase subunit I [Methanomicrobiales archaeon]